MNKSKKIFWLLLSVLFAIGSIAAGTIYDGKRKKNLDIQTVKTNATIKLDGTGNTKSIEKKDKVIETKDTNSKVGSPEKESELTESDLVAVANAENLINMIIIDGQVGNNFTLDDYRAAKAAVDNLPSSEEKTKLNDKIIEIETALTNMGITY